MLKNTLFYGFAIALLLFGQTQTTQVNTNQIRGNLVPTITVTTVTAATANSFPIPSGRSVCIVSRNIPQSPGVDYTVTGNAVVFNTVPSVGDVVQLSCF